MIRMFSSKLTTFVLVAAAPALLASAQNATAPATAPATASAGQTAAAVNTTGVSKIALINIQQAIVATNEGRRDFEVLNKKFDPKQAELKAQNDEVDRLKKDLSAQTDKLNEEERNKRVQSIEVKQKALQRSFEDAQNDYQAQSNEVAQRIGQKLMEVMDKYAKQNGIGVVIDVSAQNSNVLWGSEQANITAPVVELYNSQSGIAPPAPSAPRPSTGVRNPASKPAGTTTTPKQ
jgi:outer membrane protein